MADHQADGEAATSPPVNENSVSAQLRKVEEEIIAQRKMIESIVSARSEDPSSNDREFKMKYQAAVLEFSEKIQQYELILEEQRVASVVRDHAETEMQPPYTSDCPICLETISFTSYNSWVVFPCCGGGMCFECWQSKKCLTLKCCPLCRGNSTPDDNARLSKLLAERGHPQFQVAEGRKYMYGKDGYPVDVEKGLELINLAITTSSVGIICHGGVLQRWSGPIRTPVNYKGNTFSKRSWQSRLHRRSWGAGPFAHE